MAKNDKKVKRGVYLYIDGKEIKDDTRTISEEVRKLTKDIKDMQRGTEEYNHTAEKIRTLKAVLREHANDIKAVTAETKTSMFSFSKWVDKFNQYGGFIASMIASLTGLVLGLKALRDEQNKLEDSQASLKALTGLDDSSIEWLTGQAKVLSTTMTKEGLRVRQSADEILDAFMLVGSAKPELLGDKEALAAVTEEAMRLQAAAGDITLEQAVDSPDKKEDKKAASEGKEEQTADKKKQELAAANGQTFGQACAQLKEDYDGYHFCPDTPGMYNPFSILNTFKSRRYGSYWFETGTPTYLVELLKKSDYDLEEMSHVETDADVLDSIFTDDNPIPVIYQSGYLTIKGYDKEFGIYELGFPNREVEEGFMKFLLPYYSSVSKTSSPFEIKKFVQDVKRGDIDGFMERLQSFLADCPYELAKDIELHYQNVLFIVFRLAGLHTKVEYHTSRGRIDLVLQTDSYVYVMEFKLDGSAEQALQQIEDKQYALPFAKDSRKIYSIGVNFSSETRNIERWIVK